ncbi:cation transporter [Hathewaya histolytica]|uniref:Copper chaperone CopZ n=1 Tax=Hathewaya histolytica TaxID=1498 RepID=A0A4U9R2M6_HATHI|nr:cation transporter [Hathewaya histolytica]VTQ82920.1 copper chaperone CopZ [Hathewaya histolytica]
MKKRVLIEGMSCGHCVKHAKDALSEIKGLSNIEVNLEEKMAEFDSTSEVTDEQIKNAIEDVGYEVKDIIEL